ncbi:MAG: J domain-containing protein [Spirochaetia bacterium]
MAENYFAILGISSEASTQDVKNAYRRLAQQYHPDHGGGDSRKFMAVQEAYDVLVDPEQRRRCRQESSGERVPVRVVRTRSKERSAERGEPVWPMDEPVRPRGEYRRSRRGHVWTDESGLGFSDLNGFSSRDFDMEFEKLFERMLRTFFTW